MCKFSSGISVFYEMLRAAVGADFGAGAKADDRKDKADDDADDKPETAEEKRAADYAGEVDDKLDAE